ncbi:Oxidoreductase BOA17 [Zalerion maritima]|uniref:Oxidoreductase BOA17 n=1 Tax=Zalerion maritima TaxID=339359 RepID=A0AAD5WNU4_9PEZI|nr:Oxidoreductase BOA17 [Zalerion maritima]
MLKSRTQFTQTLKEAEVELTQPTQIFGGTGHMGRSLVKCALSHGDLVVSVGRTFESTPESMAKPDEPNYMGTLCDVRAADSVSRVFERVLDRFGRYGIVVNCSGYGVIGACEDQDEHDMQNQFETNFMGTLHIIQASLPYFRSHGMGGRYLVFSSTGGALGIPGLGPYCATKYAVEGLIEAMLYEVDSFNVKATLIEPGFARRDDPDVAGGGGTPGAATGGGEGPGGTGSKQRGEEAKGKGRKGGMLDPLPTWGHFLIKPPSEAYSHATSPALHARRIVQWLGDRQPASAVKCAELVWQLGHCSFPPLRLLLGSYAIESVRDRLRSVTEELEDWKHLNFPVATEQGQQGQGGEKEKERGQSKEKESAQAGGSGGGGEDVMMDDVSQTGT